jgi:hypothetical protein
MGPPLNRPARLCQADIARVLRALKQSGLPMRVEISPDGNIRLEPVEAGKGAPVDLRTPVDL